MRTAALVAIGLTMMGSARAVDIPGVTRKPIQIDPQELRVAIQTLGEIEGLHVVYVTEDIQNLRTRGVTGNLSPDEALEQLLGGTGLIYRFLDARTVMILPASTVRRALVEPKSAAGSADDTGKGVVAAARAPMAEVRIIAARQSDAQQLEYFRGLAAISRTEYKRLVKTLPFVDSGTVNFPGVEGAHEPLLGPGQRIQSAGVGGLVLSRVFNLGATKAEQRMQVRNSNSFPVFAEIDYGKTGFGDGAYVALAPGETLAIWSWHPTYCVLWNGAAQCSGYQIARGSARVWTFKEWEPGSR